MKMAISGVLPTLSVVLLAASLAACGGGTPQPQPQPQPQGTIAGRVFAPTGGNVEGTIVFACYPKGDGCDAQLSGQAPQILRSGQSASYETRPLSAGQYTMVAVNDLDGDNTPSASDLVGTYAPNGRARSVSPPATGIDIDLVVYQPQSEAAPSAVWLNAALEHASRRAASANQEPVHPSGR